MNLHGLASQVIPSVNPLITVLISSSAGYVTKADGHRIPQFNNVSAQAQMQPLTGRDLHQVEGLNLNGVLRSFYFYGDVEATVRNAIKGGDMITTPDRNTWLVAQVIETWPDWCKVVGVMQTGTTP